MRRWGLGHGFVPILQVRKTEAVGFKANSSGGGCLTFMKVTDW